LDKRNADKGILEQIEYFKSIGQDFEWKVYDYDKPSDLMERLSSFGLIIKDADAALVLDLNDQPERLIQAEDHNIRRIINPEDLADVQAVEQQVWNEDAEWVNHLLGGTLSDYPDRMSVYVAYIDGEPASAGWVYYAPKSQFASLWGGATVSRFRKMGLFTSLVAVRAEEAKSRGVNYLVVEAMPMSRPILEKIGFQLIAMVYPCKWRQTFEK
jgi:hypothetical protein